MPPNPLMPEAPPQKFLAPILGEVGRSLRVLAVTSGLFGGGETPDFGAGEADGEEAEARTAAGISGRGAGGGRTGVVGKPLPSRRAFLRVAISCLRATFSDFVPVSSDRIQSMRRSRSAMSPSRVVMYSGKRVNEISI